MKSHNRMSIYACLFHVVECYYAHPFVALIGELTLLKLAMSLFALTSIVSVVKISSFSSTVRFGDFIFTSNYISEGTIYYFNYIHLTALITAYSPDNMFS